MIRAASAGSGSSAARSSESSSNGASSTPGSVAATSASPERSSTSRPPPITLRALQPTTTASGQARSSRASIRSAPSAQRPEANAKARSGAPPSSASIAGITWSSAVPTAALSASAETNLIARLIVLRSPRARCALRSSGPLLWYARRVSAAPVRFLFDYISHNAYLAWVRLGPLAERFGRGVEPVPVLFAGLLNAHGQLGPAEVAPKARWMMLNVARKARRLGIPIAPPATHPFPPLLALRTTWAAPAGRPRERLIDTLFRAAWRSDEHTSDLPSR